MRFEEILVLMTGVSGAVCLGNYIYRKYHPRLDGSKDNWAIEYSKSFFPVFAVVLVLRSFVFEPFRIPTGSMKPTLIEGDFILVNKFSYGVRLPVLGTTIIPVSEPKTGDVIVFRHSEDMDLIKRVVGVPGDHIRYSNKKLYINDLEVPTEYYQETTIDDHKLQESVEHLKNVTHNIYVDPEAPNRYIYTDVIVPPNSYFVLGDNRDNSKDGRYWGFVHEKDLLGKALFTWMSTHVSWEKKKFEVRWSRFGKSIYNTERDKS